MSSVSLMRRLARFARPVTHFVSRLLTLAFRFRHYPGQRRLAEIRRWSRKFLRLAQVHLHLEHSGEPPSAGLIVMNHISSLDVVVLNALAPSRFVSKAEVAGWPLNGPACNY